MTIGGHDIVEILVNWFPMLILVGVWIYFLRRTNGQFGAVQKEAIAIQRRQAEAMEEYALSEILREIIVQEQDHEMDLCDALGIDVPKPKKA